MSISVETTYKRTIVQEQVQIEAMVEAPNEELAKAVGLDQAIAWTQENELMIEDIPNPRTIQVDRLGQTLEGEPFFQVSFSMVVFKEDEES